MKCPSCGAEVPDGAGRCRSCFAPIERSGAVVERETGPRPGLLSRMLRWLGFPSFRISIGPGRIETRLGGIRLERFEVTDKTTGEKKVYASLAGVPEEYRQKVEEAMRAGGETVRYESFRVRDPSGEWRTYGSLDEMPPEVREAVERMRKPEDGIA